MDISEILSRTWSDGGAPPPETTVRVGHKDYSTPPPWKMIPERVFASRQDIEYYREQHAGLNIYYSPVVRLETGEKITSSIVIDIDGGEFSAPDIIPFATVHTGNGEHAYIALDGIYTIDKIKPIASALNRYCGGDSHFSGEYFRRYFEGYNYKGAPPKPIHFETSPRVVRYSLNDLANKAGLLSAEPIPSSPRSSLIIDLAPREVAFMKLETALKDYKLAQIYFEGKKRKHYDNTSYASYVFALSLFWHGFTRGEIARILLHWSKGVAFSKNNPLKGELLVERITKIVLDAETAFKNYGISSPETLAIWNASSRKRGEGISERKLRMLSGLSSEDFKKGLAALLNKGLAEIRRENRAGKNSRRIIYVSRPENNLKI